MRIVGFAPAAERAKRILFGSRLTTNSRKWSRTSQYLVQIELHSKRHQRLSSDYLGCTFVSTGICTGAITSKVTFVSTDAVVASIPSALTSGVGNVTFTPAAAGSYAIIVTYAPDAASPCGTGSQTASVTLP